MMQPDESKIPKWLDKSQLFINFKGISSPVGEHSANFQHDIDWEGVKVLDKEDNWFRRGVKEAINIKRTAVT